MLTMNRTPLTVIIFLRPNKSASIPANSVEMTVPSSTAATMKDNCAAFSVEPVAASRKVASK